MATAGLALTGVAATNTTTVVAAPAIAPASIEPLSTAQDQLVLRYDEPANDWQSRSLPIGNGAMGASIFGGVSQDSIQMNEKTL
ncbi:glycoside hydrolase N-terminal domain-containing protein [Actinomyces trachealis]|uniref:glycoside hydrolase N-terminal domain-containing protein n=1 Tax=Actinomyces trachealis TaxID=2763540 RepID=UPI001892A14C|nr:glycoside hydrolase N-terminal domain-containing protein [Actinomyces trachealis]